MKENEKIDLVQQRIKTFTICGSSDDLIIAVGLPGCDDFGNYSDRELKGVGRLTSNDGSLLIYCYYNNTGCWHFSPGLAGEGLNFPSWPITFVRADNGYSTVLQIEVPPETVFNMILT